MREEKKGKKEWKAGRGEKTRLMRPTALRRLLGKVKLTRDNKCCGFICFLPVIRKIIYI